MHRALHWFKQNNRYYRHIDIDYDCLNQLPEDDNLSGLSKMKAKVEQYEKKNMTNEREADEMDSFIPVTVQKMTEEEAIKKYVAEKQPSAQSRTITWPARGSTPINEFITEGYIFCAFPSLFSTGCSDFLAPRERAVTVGNYFKHLLKYSDGRFARHPRFHYFALNTDMWWRALQTGKVYIKQHPNDAKLSLDYLKELVQSGR